MHGARLHRMSQRDAMARDPRQDLLGRVRDRDISLRNETRDASVWDETRRDVSTSRDRLETETSQPRPHPWYFQQVNSKPAQTVIRCGTANDLAAEECIFPLLNGFRLVVLYWRNLVGNTWRHNINKVTGAISWLLFWKRLALTRAANGSYCVLFSCSAWPSLHCNDWANHIQNCRITWSTSSIYVSLFTCHPVVYTVAVPESKIWGCCVPLQTLLDRTPFTGITDKAFHRPMYYAHKTGGAEPTAPPAPNQNCLYITWLLCIIHTTVCTGTMWVRLSAEQLMWQQVNKSWQTVLGSATGILIIVNQPHWQQDRQQALSFTHCIISVTVKCLNLCTRVVR